MLIVLEEVNQFFVRKKAETAILWKVWQFLLCFRKLFLNYTTDSISGKMNIKLLVDNDYFIQK